MGREARNGVQTGLGLSISLPVNAEAQQIISRLGMKKLPGEGGFFVPTWTSSLKGQGGRPLSSSILFLITGAEFSALHRLQMDEIWHFSAGDPAELVKCRPGCGATAAHSTAGGLFQKGRGDVVSISAHDPWHADQPHHGTDRTAAPEVGRS